MSQIAAQRPRIVVLSYSPIARDPRVLRQVKKFATFADVVTVGYGPRPPGVVDHVEVPAAAIPWRAGRFRTPLLYLTHWWRRLYFKAPRVTFVQRAIPAGSMDVVVANDEFAVPVALTLKPRGGVHADLHEYSPRVGEDRPGWRRRVAPYMRWAVSHARLADSVTTVAPGLAAEYEREFGIRAQVVPNTPRYRELPVRDVSDPIRLVHIGIAGRARKLELMIDALEIISRTQPGKFTLDIIVAPGQADYIDELSQRASRAPSGVVRILPPVSYDEIIPTLAGYDMGLFVSPPTTFNLEHALPNKFFEYVQARLAVLIGPSPEMSPYVNEYGFGLITQDFTAQAIADALSSLLAADVTAMKQAADKAAYPLSDEPACRPWLTSVAALLQRAGFAHIDVLGNLDRDFRAQAGHDE